MYLQVSLRKFGQHCNPDISSKVRNSTSRSSSSSGRSAPVVSIYYWIHIEMIYGNRKQTEMKPYNILAGEKFSWHFQSMWSLPAFLSVAVREFRR